MDPTLAWMAALPAAEFLRSSAWAYPLAEVVHIVGLALLVGSVFVVDLRLMGAGRALPLHALMRFVLPWTLASLLLVVPSGLLLFLAHAPELAANAAFRIKLALLMLAALNAWYFHRYSKGTADAKSVARGRQAGWISLTRWLSIIAAGRLIAYV